MDTDASLAEINPLIREAKRSRRWTRSSISTPTRCSAIRRSSPTATSTKKTRPKIEASKFDLAYIQLDGNIGCLVNGAASRWRRWTRSSSSAASRPTSSTSAAASAEKVTEAFKIMLASPKVKGILVNIFGGIMRCDTIAEGVIAACKASTCRCRWWCA